MSKYIALFIVLFSVSSAHAGALYDFSQFAARQCFSYWCSGGKFPSVAELSRPKALAQTTLHTATTQFTTPIVTHAALYMLGISAGSPLLPSVVGFFSEIFTRHITGKVLWWLLG